MQEDKLRKILYNLSRESFNSTIIRKEINNEAILDYLNIIIEESFHQIKQYIKDGQC